MQSIGKMPSKKPEEKAIRDECNKTLEALNSSKTNKRQLFSNFCN